MADEDLHDKLDEDVGERCIECGAKLTDQEIEDALERGGPNLCTVHATESMTTMEEGPI